MSTDLETRQVLVPHTGEVLDLAAPPEQLAQLLDEVRDVESRLRELKAEVSREIHARMDVARKWTLDAGPYKLVGKSDAPEEEWDVDALAATLTELVDDGAISTEAMDAACEVVTTFKVRKAGINALRKNPELAAVIDECVTTKPPENRRLSLKRVG